MSTPTDKIPEEFMQWLEDKASDNGSEGGIVRGSHGWQIAIAVYRYLSQQPELGLLKANRIIVSLLQEVDASCGQDRFFCFEESVYQNAKKWLEESPIEAAEAKTEEKPNLPDTIKWLQQSAMMNHERAETTDAMAYYDGYVDALVELEKEMEIHPAAAPSIAEPIPEKKDSDLRELRTVKDVIDWIDRDALEHKKAFPTGEMPPFVNGAMNALQNLRSFIHLRNAPASPSVEPIAPEQPRLVRILKYVAAVLEQEFDRQEIIDFIRKQLAENCAAPVPEIAPEVRKHEERRMERYAQAEHVKKHGSKRTPESDGYYDGYCDGQLAEYNYRLSQLEAPSVAPEEKERFVAFHQWANGEGWTYGIMGCWGKASESKEIRPESKSTSQLYDLFIKESK